MIGGCTPASPTPTTTRQRNSCKKLRTSPQQPANSEKTATAIATSFIRLRVSANRARGRPKMA